MVKLTDLQVASLLEEIACAMRVGTPIADSMRRLESRRLGRIAGAAKTVADGLERGETIADAISKIASPASAQAAAAIRACQENGNSGLLERMAHQLRLRSEHARSFRLAWFYPWLLLAVGYFVGVAVMAPMIREMHGQPIDWPTWLVGLSNWLQGNWWLPPLMIAIGLVGFVFWLRSRDRFPRSVRLGLFCNSLADQFTYDVPEDVAIRTAAEMSGDVGLMSISQPTLQSAEVARIIAMSDPSEAKFLHSPLKETLIAKLRFLGSLYNERARQQAFLWSRFVPRLAMVAVGFGITFSYAWWVIAPVYRQVAQW
jgi:hypothetical protein